MNDLYNETVVRRGKIYHYDPDYDCYYSTSSNESTASKYAWIVVTVLLGVCAYYIEYIR
jgi:hypothetical protein